MTLLMIKEQLGNLQLELLKLYSTDVSDEDLEKVKALLATYFAEKVISDADAQWDENNFSNDDMDKWLENENS